MNEPPASVTVDRLAGGYSGRMLFLIATCSLVSTLGWLVLPPLLPELIDDLAITGTQAGFAVTVLTGLSALLRFPGGRLADQLSRKTVVAISILAWISGFSILSVATTYGILLLGVTFVGIGAGMFVPTAFALLSDLFDQKQGRAFGINNAAFNLGGILAAGLAIVVLALGDWRLAFLPVIVALLPALALLHLWNRESYTIHRVELEVVPTARRILLNTRVLTLLVVAALFSFSWNGAVSFLPTFLEAERGLTASLASIGYATVFVTGVVATPLAGAVGDRIGTLRTVFGTLAFAVTGLAIMLTMTITTGVLAGILVFAVGITGFWPVMTAYMMASFPQASKAGDYGAIGTVYMGAGSIGPTFVGATGQHLTYTVGYLGIGVALSLCMVLVWYMRYQD